MIYSLTILIGFALLAGMIVFSDQITIHIRRFLSVPLLFVLASVGSQKEYGVNESDDFVSYYNNYLNMESNPWGSIFEYGYDGFREVGIGFINYVAYRLSPGLMPNELMYIYTLIGIIGFYIWLEKYAIKYFPIKYHALLISISLSLIGLTVGSQLCRQFFSSVFILYALTTGWSKWLFLFAATAFHLTAIPIYYLIKCLSREGVVGMFLVLLLFAFVVFINQAAELFSGKFYVNKFTDYFSASTSHIVDSLNALKIPFVLFLLAVPLNNFFKIKPNAKVFLGLNYLAVNIFIASVVLIELPFASVRLFLPYFCFLLGVCFVSFLVVNKFNENFIKSISFAIVVTKLFAWLSMSM